MSDDDLDQRLTAAGIRLTALAGELQRAEPWPFAARFDHAPEASWGPPEILAHLEEMLLFWLGEVERILEPGAGAVTFGRAPTDDRRLAIIARDRTLPVSELVDRVQLGIERWRRRWTELDAERRQQGADHLSLGRMTVTDIATRLAVGHLESHLDQLAAAIAGGRPAG